MSVPWAIKLAVQVPGMCSHGGSDLCVLLPMLQPFSLSLQATLRVKNEDCMEQYLKTLLSFYARFSKLTCLHK